MIRRCINNRKLWQAAATRLSMKNVRHRNVHSDMFEPEYLKDLVPEIPLYSLLNIQLKGYDFPPLEHYAKYVAKTATHMDLDVVESWATPGKALHVKSFVTGTVNVDKEYTVTLYERNVQIADTPSTVLPLFLQIIRASVPEGVQVSVHPHKQEHEEVRYIPDLELEELEKELDVIKHN